MDEQMNTNAIEVVSEIKVENANQGGTEEKKVKWNIKNAFSPKNLGKTVSVSLAVIAVIVGAFFLIKSRSEYAVGR